MLDGPSLILGNLLRELDPGKVALFTRARATHTGVYFKKGNELNIKRYCVYVPTPYSVTYSAFLRRVVRAAEVATIPYTTIKGLLAARKERPDDILATSDIPHGHFMIAAYLMARILRKRLFFYLFDPIEEFTTSRMYRALLGFFEPRMFAYATEVITMNSFLGDYYEKKYGIKCKVLHHSVESSGEALPARRAGGKDKEVNIVFSGTISKYQLDALSNLREAIDLMEGNIKLLIYTPTKESTVREYGFTGAKIQVEHVDHITLKAELKNADILFLPLSFENADSIIVKAAFPSKTMDYMVAGRPTLVHAPGSCFIVEYARRCGFAEVVADNNVETLARATERLLADKKRQRELTKNARKTLLNHDPKVKCRELIEIMGSK